MKRALVLSGGGANGAFQVGALRYIREQVQKKHPNFDFDIIVGVSVGAINASLLSMDAFEQLENIWNSPNLERLIFRGKLDIYNLGRRILRRERSLLDNGPLFDLLRRYIDLDTIKQSKYDLRICMVSLRNGKCFVLKKDAFMTNEDLQKAILASTSIPVLWNPVDKIETVNGPIHDLVDGSIRDTSPLGHVVHDKPDEIVIINCRSPKVSIPEDEHSTKSLFSIAYRSLVDIILDEIFINDLREFLIINDLVGQVKKKHPEMELYRTRSNGEKFALKRFQTVLIEPDEDLGNLLDFSTEKIQWRMQEGYEAARRTFKNYENKLTYQVYVNKNLRVGE